MNTSQILFRCSSLGHIMGKAGLTEKQEETLTTLQNKEKRTVLQEKTLLDLYNKKNNPELPDTAKTHCVDVFISWYYKRREEVTSKFLDKGNAREQDSLTLLSRNEKRFFKKNSIRLSNDFITGEPDIFTGELITNADEVIDTKTSWSLHTFLRAKQKPIDQLYLYQIHGYMDLTGAKSGKVAYCLVNGTAQAIDDEKKRLAWSMGIIDTDAINDETIKYKEKCRQIEINHIFDMPAFVKENPFYVFDNDLDEWKYDIDFSERQFSFVVERDEEVIQKIHSRVTDCRKWINDNLLNRPNS